MIHKKYNDILCYFLNARQEFVVIHTQLASPSFSRRAVGFALNTAVGSGLLVTLGVKRVAALGTLHVLSRHLPLANGARRQLLDPKPYAKEISRPHSFSIPNLVLVAYAPPVDCHTKAVLCLFPVPLVLTTLDSVLTVVEGAGYGDHIFLTHGAAAVVIVLQQVQVLVADLDDHHLPVGYALGISALSFQAETALAVPPFWGSNFGPLSRRGSLAARYIGKFSTISLFFCTHLS